MGLVPRHQRRTISSLILMDRTGSYCWAFRGDSPRRVPLASEDLAAVPRMLRVEKAAHDGIAFLHALAMPSVAFTRLSALSGSEDRWPALPVGGVNGP
jgi:hypothetical protein